MNYQLLSEEERERSGSHRRSSKSYHKTSPIGRVIERFTLPKPRDAIGRKKELLEKLEILTCLLSGIAIIVGIFVSNGRSYPERSRAYDFTYEGPESPAFPVPVFGLCFPMSTFRGWTPVVWRMTQRKNYNANQTATCEHWSPAGRRLFSVSPSWPSNQMFRTPAEQFSCQSNESNLEERCASVVKIDYDQQCVSFGNENCQIWQALAKLEVVEVQLLAFWSGIDQFPTTTPGGWYDNSTIFFENASAHRTQILLGGITQAILEFKREDFKVPDLSDWKRWDFTSSAQYPTSITTLNVLDNHFFCRPGTLVETNHMCYNITNSNGDFVAYAPPTAFSALEFQIRLQTKVIATTTTERVWDFLFRSLKDIGGFLGVIFTVVTFLISKLLTRIIFSQPDAFFDTQMRLAATHFQKTSESTNEE